MFFISCFVNNLIYKYTVLNIQMVVSYHDGSKLPEWQALGISLMVTGQLEGRGGALETLRPTLVPGQNAVWHLKMDLYKLLRKWEFFFKTYLF